MKHAFIYMLVIAGLTAGSCTNNTSKTEEAETDELATGVGAATAVPGVAGKTTAAAIALTKLQKDSVAMYNRLIQGKWVSVDDSKSVLVFTADKQIAIYDNKNSDTSAYSISYQSCNGTDNGELYLKVDDDMCYAFNGLDDKTLSIMYLSNGKNFVYKRQ